MTDIVSIKFRGRGKAYSFDPADLQVQAGQTVIVETSKGLELGECTLGNHPVPDESVIAPLRPVVRVATPDDLRVAEINHRREAEAHQIALEKIAAHGLDMKLVDVECSFGGNKILFFFTSDGRVDFRELVKDLASVFRTRIELRQIGVRDEAKMLGGLGICGRPFCCNSFLGDFQPVSTKMAKVQSMSLNPAKISGTCGRLMCCLRYEQEAYEELVKHVPKNGAFVQTEDGYGNVTQVNLLRQTVKVKLDGAGDPVFHSYPVDEIAEVPGGRPRPGEEPPSLLTPKPKAAPEAAAPAAWARFDLFGASSPPAPGVRQEEARQAAGHVGSRRRGRQRPKDQAPAQRAEGGEPAKPKAPVKRPGTPKPTPDGLRPAPESPKPPQPAKAREIPGVTPPPQKKKSRGRRYGKPRQDS